MLFTSKILLFGEYNLVIGGSGFAIPFERFGGELAFTIKKPENEGFFAPGQAESNHSIRNLCDYMKDRWDQFRFLNLDKLTADVKDGLRFVSDIPGSYGLGSSGALVAALYKQYASDLNVGLKPTKERLALIESYFHGSSSGVDPAVAYYHQPILIRCGVNVEPMKDWKLKNVGLSVYLADTGIESDTKDLVHWFKLQLGDFGFMEQTKTYFMEPTNKVVHLMAENKAIEINDLLVISKYQYDYLSPMIPTHFRRHFESGLNSGNFAFKLCGSGGGGYMLVFVKNEKAFANYCLKNEIKTIKVSS